MKSLTCATIDVSVLSHVQVFVTLWTVAYQAPLCMGFSRQEYTEELYKKDLHDPDNHDGVITDLDQTSWNVKSSGP